MENFVVYHKKIDYDQTDGRTHKHKNSMHLFFTLKLQKKKLMHLGENSRIFICSTRAVLISKLFFSVLLFSKLFFNFRFSIVTQRHFRFNVVTKAKRDDIIKKRKSFFPKRLSIHSKKSSNRAYRKTCSNN